ncbi:MAG: DDE-type integrase/transposase/recombinase, partial [Nitrosopumilus sp.]
FTDKIKPTKLGTKINIDEQMVRTKHKEFVWSWNAIDNKTRFLIANNVTKEKYVEDAKEIFQKIKDVKGTDEQITLVTDAMKSYPHAIGQVFHKINDWRAGQKAVRHIANAGINQVHKNNNMVERYHNDFREFDKVRRGFDNVKQFNEGFRLYHNFIKENSVLGMTPSEKAGINLDLGNNRWLGLLKKSLLNSDDMSGKSTNATN